MNPNYVDNHRLPQSTRKSQQQPITNTDQHMSRRTKKGIKTHKWTKKVDKLPPKWKARVSRRQPLLPTTGAPRTFSCRSTALHPPALEEFSLHSPHKRNNGCYSHAGEEQQPIQPRGKQTLHALEKASRTGAVGSLMDNAEDV